MINWKSFETALIVVGIFLVMLEFYNFNTNLRACYGTFCGTTILHYIITIIGIGMVLWGLVLFNTRSEEEEEWLIDWEKL